MKDKTVVFGGSGFLGSHVADCLTDAGYSVFVFDKAKSPYLRSNQEMVLGDVLDQSSVLKVIEGARYVYNFAGIADIDESANKPLDTIKNNIVGHSIILDACVKQKVERMLFASSIYVYSRFGSFYKVSKQACELITESFFEKYGLKYTILRYGSLYGPRSQMWNGIYRYIYQAMLKNKIDYPGSGDEKREYIHVSDAARLSVEVLKTEFENNSVIITGVQTLSANELLSTIKSILGKDIKLNFLAKGPDYHYSLSPYCFAPKVARKLVANPFIDLGQGFLQVMEEIHKLNHSAREPDKAATRKRR